MLTSPLKDMSQKTRICKETRKHAEKKEYVCYLEKKITTQLNHEVSAPIFRIAIVIP